MAKLPSLTDEQREVLDLLLSEPFAGRDALREQAQTVRTAGPSCGCGCPSFSLVPDRSLPPAEVEDRVPVDALGVDPGGNPVGVLLFVDEGYLSDVEVFNWEGSDFAGLRCEVFEPTFRRPSGEAAAVFLVPAGLFSSSEL